MARPPKDSAAALPLWEQEEDWLLVAAVAVAAATAAAAAVVVHGRHSFGRGCSASAHCLRCSHHANGGSVKNCHGSHRE